MSAVGGKQTLRLSLTVDTAEPMSGAENQRTAWGAQLHLRPLPAQDGGLGGAKGAFAWVFALANSEAEYREIVSAEMEAVGLFIAEVEHLGRYERIDGADDPSSRCINRLSDEWPVQYHNFHTYHEED
jgi:hypothetical protein